MPSALGLGVRTNRNILANYLGQGWAGLMAIAFLPVYIDHLGMEAYGLIGFFAVMSSLLSVLDLGAMPTVTRETARFAAGEVTVERVRDLLRSLEWICFGVAAAIAMVIWWVAPHLAQSWVRPHQLPVSVVTDAIAIMALALALRCCEGVYRGTLVGLERQVLYNWLIAAMATLRYGGAVLVLLVFPSIEAFFLWQVMVSFLTLTVLMGGAYHCLPSPGRRAGFSPAVLHSVWRFSIGMTVISGLSMVTLNLDKLLLSAQLPLEAFGHYALASTAASILYMAVVPVTQAVFPRLIGHLGRGEESALETAYRRASRWVVVIAGPAAFVLAAFSAEIIFVWSGDRHLAEQISPILSVLALAALLNCISHVPFNLQLARGATRLLIITNAALVAVAAVVIPVAGAAYGVTGAAFAWLGLNLFHALTIVHVAHDKLTPATRKSWIYRDIAAPMCGALVVIALAGQVRPEYHTEGRLALALFLILLGLGATIASAWLALWPLSGTPAQPTE